MAREQMAFHSRQRDKIEPLLRWAGGKRFLVNHFTRFVPPDFDKNIYYEPFLGSGSLFFALRPRRARLSDANEHLMDCYRHVRDNPDLVANYLCRHGLRDGEKYYYKVREKYNRSGFSSAQAARFIYLNRACFNGIFRVNLKGEFNVPYGWKKAPIIPDRVWLRKASAILKKANLASAPFEKALKLTSFGDFIYLDPPYPPLNSTSNFTRYTKDRFNETDQRRLANTVHDLSTRGCLVMMSNADTPLIRELFRDYNIYSLSVTRWITCKSKKHKVNELIITNYRYSGKGP
jgi:DNA adenine methylase